MSERPFETDHLTGQRTFFSFDNERDEFTIRTEHDVTGLIEDNKRQQNLEPNERGAKFKGDMHRVASIPLTIYCELKAQGIIGPTPEHARKLKAWLNDPDNRLFRTKLGRV